MGSRREKKTREILILTPAVGADRRRERQNKNSVHVPKHTTSPTPHPTHMDVIKSPKQ